MADVVALTGATGFVGAAVAARLVAAGWRVRALVRAASDERLRTARVDRVHGSLEDQSSLERLIRGARVVVHCAGLVRGFSPSDFERVNVEGVARLARTTAREVSPPRVILVSSAAARQPELSDYAASKLRGERALAAEAAAWTVLRPPAVYGPGDRALLPLLRWMQRGVGLVLGPRSARFSLLHVEDLADAIVRLVETDGLAPAAFELHDGSPAGYAWDDVLAAVSRLRGRVVRRAAVPAWALRLLAHANVRVARVRGRAPMLTPGKVRELTHLDWVCDNAAIEAATGWTPRIGLDAGLRRTLGLPEGAPPDRAAPVADRGR